ncbi:hypothetical protein [Mesorhizobium erdmanii]|uniref:Uncharacterized protein n=1 Tax=Mesorhizobium erdmanii TaxID=1777866 RepID=A0A6M7UQL8_9HYPH|nr:MULTISPECIES: hypothetical protein [Mesorhizobium]OBQ67973.1 hypothetical protein A8146_11180 [Mesorhizobium loti]QKC79415.1 hypothetical protein EB233_31615 [Mesorhizobium erdmanii]
MSKLRKDLDVLLSTVDALCSIPSMNEYLIGHTRLPAWQKATEYRRVGFQHLAVLVDKLDREESLAIEHELQRSIFASIGSPLLEKYHKEKRDHRVLSRSYGGSPTDPAIKECSVYIVWY